MAMPGLGDDFEAAVVHRFNGVDEQINVWAFNVGVAGTGSQGDFEDDLIEFLTAVYQEIESDISDKIVVEELRWRNITDDGPTQFVPWHGPYVGGTGSGDALPPQVSALMLLRTGVKGVQGRKYMPAYTEPTQSGGLLTTAALGRLQAAAAVAIGPWSMTITGMQINAIVWSRSHGQAYDVAAIQARQRLAIQRRRAVGRGS